MALTTAEGAPSITAANAESIANEDVGIADVLKHLLAIIDGYREARIRALDAPHRAHAREILQAAEAAAMLVRPTALQSMRRWSTLSRDRCRLFDPGGFGMDGQAGHYEFSPAQNEILRRAATWTGVFAWIMMIGAGLMALGAAFSGEAASIASLIAAAVYFVVGLSFRGAASSFHAVVQTTGNDLEHLMSALDRLGSAFKVMGIVFLVGIVLFVAATVAVWAWMSSISV